MRINRPDALEIYESWEISIPAITHSYLNHLAPVGLETALVESLTSYIARLADSHRMNVGTLLEREVAPLINKKYGAANPQSISRLPGVMNGIGSMSRELVCMLEHLTMRQDLCGLTMLSFGEVIPSRNLFRPVRAWCPICYQSCVEREQALYEPLLWSLKLVRCCPVHQISLVDKCPNCQQQNPSFSRKYELGFCSRCSAWLGQESKQLAPARYVNDLELWKTQSLGVLLAMTPNSRTKLSADNIPQQLSRLANEATAGNMAALARRLKIPKNTLWLWHRGEVVPSLESSLDICYHFHLALTDFFTGEERISLNLNNWQVSTKQQSQTNTESLSFDLEAARHVLESELSQEDRPPISVSEIARRLGCHRRVLYKYFPDLCSAIAAIYKKYVQQSRQDNIDYCCQQVRQIVAQLYIEGRYPSEGLVVGLMDKPGFLRYEEVRSALKQARASAKPAASSNKA